MTNWISFMHLADITVLECIGLAGAALYSLGYFLAAYDRLPSQSPLYYLCKMLAAVLVMISLTESFNLASAVIQAFFIFVSVIGILRHFDARRRERAYAMSQAALGGQTTKPALPPRTVPRSDRSGRSAMPFVSGHPETADRNCRNRSDLGCPNS